MLDLLRGIIALAEDRPMDVRLQRLAEEARGAGWRPIETAPRDGRPILVYFAKPELGIMRVTWEDPHGDGAWQIWCVDDNKHGPYPVRGYVDGDDTHWMPLPEPPQLPEIPIYAMDAHKPEGE